MAPSGTVASGTRAASLSVTWLDRRVTRRKRAVRAWGPLGPLAALFYASDPQTGGAPVKIRGRNVRSKDQCSMCPAIHTKSRSWLRSSSTLEPSDPPLGVVFSFWVSCRLQSLTVKINFEMRKGDLAFQIRWRRVSGWSRNCAPSPATDASGTHKITSTSKSIVSIVCDDR